MPSQRTQQLLDRIPSGHSRSEGMRKVVEATLTIAERFRARRGELDADPRLTRAGKADALKDELVKRTARALRDAKAPVAAARSELETLRHKIKAKPAEPENLHAAIIGTEIRTLLAGMDPGKRMGLLVGPDVDKRVLEAALIAPPLLTGLSAADYAMVERAYQAARFPAEIAEIEVLDEVIANAEAAASIARQELQSTMEMDARSFDALVRPIETKRDAPWLTADGSQVVEVGNDGRASYRPASPEDQREGVRFNNMAEWEAFKAKAA